MICNENENLWKMSWEYLTLDTKQKKKKLSKIHSPLSMPGLHKILIGVNSSFTSSSSLEDDGLNPWGNWWFSVEVSSLITVVNEKLKN